MVLVEFFKNFANSFKDVNVKICIQTMEARYDVGYSAEITSEENAREK